MQSLLMKKIVEAKLMSAGALAYVKLGRIGHNALGLLHDDSMLLEFQGLSADARYRMLVSFAKVELNTAKARRLIEKSKVALKVDLAVFCTDADLSFEEKFDLKRVGAHVLSVGQSAQRLSRYQTVPDFIHVPEVEYRQLLEMNILANEIAKRLRKKFHLVLSELAADSYDSYGTFATKEVMRFEDDLLRDTLAAQLNGEKGKFAIDVGCGNGRHSRVLAKHFDQVIAFDLSKKMVEAASLIDKDQLPADIAPVTYYECDVEYEEFPDEADIIGKADFVCASFGMPSFVEDTFGFVRRVYRWLRPNGRALFTFYNSQSVSLVVGTPWKDRALSASIDLARQALEVELRQDVRFSIYCRAFDEGVKEIVKALFKIRREGTFPHMMALMPPSVFGTEQAPSRDARNLFSRIDRAMAWEPDTAKGHYVFVIVEKVGGVSEGLLRVQAALKASKVEHEIISHREVVSTGEVQRELGLLEDQMVKTVVFKRLDTKELMVILLPPRSRVNVAKLAELANCAPAQLGLARAEEIEERLGFPVGGVAPVGYPRGMPIFIDESLKGLTSEWVYMGVGDNRKTLKVSNEVFHHLTEAYCPGQIAVSVAETANSQL